MPLASAASATDVLSAVPITAACGAPPLSRRKSRTISLDGKPTPASAQPRQSVSACFALAATCGLASTSRSATKRAMSSVALNLSSRVCGPAECALGSASVQHPCTPERPTARGPLGDSIWFSMLIGCHAAMYPMQLAISGLAEPLQFCSAFAGAARILLTKRRSVPQVPNIDQRGGVQEGLAGTVKPRPIPGEWRDVEPRPRWVIALSQ